MKLLKTIEQFLPSLPVLFTLACIGIVAYVAIVYTPVSRLFAAAPAPKPAADADKPVPGHDLAPDYVA